jgi:hypothetical protein
MVAVWIFKPAILAGFYFLSGGKMSNKRLFTLLVTAGLLSMTGTAFADTSNSNNASVQSTQQELNQMSAEINALNKEIKILKVNQNQLKFQQQVAHNRAVVVRGAAPQPGVIGISTTQSGTLNIPANGSAQGKAPLVTYLSGTPVVIAPYVGDHVAFNGSDLIVNYSSYNEDLHLLQLRQSVYGQYQQMTYPNPAGPMLMLSGQITGTGAYTDPNNAYHSSRFDLPAAELDVIPTLNDWAGGIITMKYDNTQMPNQPLTSNSHVFVDRAFVTLGNLNQFPLYLTMGQMYVPFGTYSSNMISATLPQMIFQTRARALLLGYQNANAQGPYGEVYAFNGDADTSNHNDNVNDVGANLGFAYSNNSANVDAGIGAIADVADSLGMQATGATTSSMVPNFTGFSSTTSMFTGQEDIIQHQVPGISTHLNFGIGNFGVNSEYLKATQSFSPLDMTYNGHGARPQAMNVEAYYNFPVFSKPSAITLGYGQTWQALALGVPEHRYIAAVTTSIWRDTVEEIEFRHDINYSGSDSASAFGVQTPSSTYGGTTNTLTAEIALYF